MLGGGTWASATLISQQALNTMTMREALTPPSAFTPRTFVPIAFENNVPNFAHFASPMVHPTTGETISSYKRLMNDPETAEIWQTAFGKDFGGVAQGDNKTGQKRANSVFVMTHTEIDIVKAAGHTWTYAQVVVDYRPQKEDTNWIRIAVGGNLITYRGNTSTRTANLTTSKLLWNSVLSTEGACYMCLVIKNFYLTAALDYYEYMKIKLALFPEWIKMQYNLNTHARDGFAFLEIRRAVWGLPQVGILANKLLRKWLKPHGYYECVNTPGLWWHATQPITFSLVVNDFGVKYAGKEHADNLISCLKMETYKLTKDWVGDLLRHHAAMGLCKTMVRHCNARMHQKTIVKIRAHHATNTTLSILTGTKKIQRRCSVPSPKRYFAEFERKRNKTGAENCWKHSILRESSGHASVNGIKYNCKWANTGHGTYLGKGIPGPLFLGDTPKCGSAISSIRHGDEYPFRRVIFKWTESTKQSMWPFFHGHTTEGWRTHQIKWRFSYTVFNIKICCGVSGGSRTGSTFSQLPRGDDF